jgi:hypothetical protein
MSGGEFVNSSIWIDDAQQDSPDDVLGAGTHKPIPHASQHRTIHCRQPMAPPAPQRNSTSPVLRLCIAGTTLISP